MGNGEMILVGIEDGKSLVTWLDRNGDVRSSTVIPNNFSFVGGIFPISKDRILIVGQTDTSKNKKVANNQGRALIVSPSGDILVDVLAGEENSAFTNGTVLKDGNLLLGGYEVTTDGRKNGMVMKMDTDGKVIYRYIASQGAICTDVNVLGSETEYLHVAFSAENSDEYSSVVRLDNKGKAFFITDLPDAGYKINKMLTASDGSIFLIGGSNAAGGTTIKISTEGDIIFNKVIVPAAPGASVDFISVADNSNILVGGSGGNRGQYTLLRNDGTVLATYIVNGEVTAVNMNKRTGESVITTFDKSTNFGYIVGLNSDGKKVFDKQASSHFDKIRIDNNGIFLAGASTGRVCLISPFGETWFDRYIIENRAESFNSVHFTSNGEIIFMGAPNRLIKMAHGLYVSNVKINKPVNGLTPASFTITLSGYATNDQGAPVPVYVNYQTKDNTAKQGLHYEPVNGSLSFVPSNDGANRYMVKQEVEVPVKANDLVEGQKMFELVLSDVKESYIITESGVGSIEDQEVLIKMIASEDGIEGEKDVVYELGLFKTNGEPLVNATGTNIWIDGSYGKGTADALDFDMGIIPRVTIADGQKSGKFNVKTLSDTRFELPKTVVVDFDRIHAIDGVNVRFESSLLSCSGIIIDQPAIVSIQSLGDHGRMNNIVSGFFTISLLRASDGALLTNDTGSDIQLNIAVAPETTADEGKDFVLTNMHDLRIWGDGNRSAVNLNGIVLYNKDVAADKRLMVNIESVTAPEGAPELSISVNGKQAGFTIKN
ncbi:MAG: hypothetical protein LIP01_00700 [Tannerellaceae bacterium]|nr:hypothetical protein [Tannerellaceae bacterium]